MRTRKPRRSLVDQLVFDLSRETAIALNTVYRNPDLPIEEVDRLLAIAAPGERQVIAKLEQFDPAALEYAIARRLERPDDTDRQ